VLMSRLYNVYRFLFAPLFRRGSSWVEPQKEFRVGDADVSAFAMAGILPEPHDEEGHFRIRIAAVNVPEDKNFSVLDPGFSDHLNRCADSRSEVILADIVVVIVDYDSTGQHPMFPVGGDRCAVRGEFFYPGCMFSWSGKIQQNIFPDSDGSVLEFRGCRFFDC